MLLIKLMLLLLIANGAPILSKRIMAKRYDFPIDGAVLFFDHRPILGKSKTWRGLISSLVITSIAAVVLQLHWQAGLIIAGGAMAGDLLSSFIKRRLGISASDQALFLDQIPESLIPLILVSHTFELTRVEIIAMTLSFLVIELLLSKLLYQFKIRNRPY